jgi:glycosyltransferase involved in cell wall biosynthesis
VGDLLDAIDLIVLPSVRDEGCSNTLLEAMCMASRPSSRGAEACPSVVENGAQGIVVEIGDEDGLGKAIARLLTDERERGRMGAAARRAIEEKFTRDGAARMLVSLLLSLPSLI